MKQNQRSFHNLHTIYAYDKHYYRTQVGGVRVINTSHIIGIMIDSIRHDWCTQAASCGHCQLLTQLYSNVFMRTVCSYLNPSPTHTVTYHSKREEERLSKLLPLRK